MISLSLVVVADTFDDVVNMLKAQQAKEIAKMFNQNVEMTINDNEGVYSKQQAEIMLKNFLSQNQAKAVSIQHRGSSGQGAKYVIAIYETNLSKFRIYIFMKESGGTSLIHELRIEKEQ